MGHADYYADGDYNATCQRCGGKFKASECELEWTGLFVCKETCYEPRHPQDFVRGVKEDQTVPIASPPPPPIFVE